MRICQTETPPAHSGVVVIAGASTGALPRNAWRMMPCAMCSPHARYPSSEGWMPSVHTGENTRRQDRAQGNAMARHRAQTPPCGSSAECAVAAVRARVVAAVWRARAPEAQ